MSNLDLISRKALLEALRLEGDVFMSRGCVEQLIASAPAVEQGEPAAEVSHADVLPNRNGLYEHRFLFPDRLAVQTELYLYDPNKQQSSDKSKSAVAQGDADNYTSPQTLEWVGLSDEDIKEIFELGHQAYPQFARAIEAKLRALNTKG